ncbi:hypothetical protein KOI35_43875 [Actinoplanes bogorensis]|uniref:Teneurin-like YD-shell domain-containing protein n=1 Tax=Paractinoplanes bogorensis TaxID=1610840 RepID=A0ABS5Z452_9ACTN|nr:RHS repeat-associated core domain-containing protein [Actinoplanes bogorensis]MBU2670463.1 hypothetical protein [Actinoplanes bogorensis]
MDTQIVKFGRRSRWLAFPLATLLAVTVVGPSAALGVPAKWDPPKPADVKGVRVEAVKPKAAAPLALPPSVDGPRKVTWPAAGSAEVALSATAVPRTAALAATATRAGTLPVRIGTAAADATANGRSLAAPDRPSRVKVTLHDRPTAERAGVSGLLLDVARTDRPGTTGAVSVTVDYSSFADAYGGDWATRLRLVEVTGSVRRQLSTVNDAARQTLTATVPLAATGTTLATEAGASGDNGDYSATDLSAAATWDVSKQTGDFSYSLPMRAPQASGGPAPALSLDYSSSNVDGLTGGTNTQGGWAGDGWSMWSGFIERKYAGCADDNPDHKTGDQCWFNENATLSLSGHAGELIQDGSVWRLKKDDGTKIEKVKDADRANGDNDNEYWRVTTTDGTKYYFGYHRLPGWVSGKPVTDSVWTVPVYGNGDKDPCHADKFSDSHCKQAWRWNLDYVVDPQGNSMAYYYGSETGAYGTDNDKDKRTTYDRGGYLKRVEYGMRAGAEYDQAAPLRVAFDTAERCKSGCWAGEAWNSKANKSAWPDTPWDQYCEEGAKCTEQLAPTFWSARRLTKVTTQKRSGPTSYADIESWTLRQDFLNAGTGETTPMWLSGVTHAGLLRTVNGDPGTRDAVTDPEIQFGTGAEPLNNRVDAVGDSRSGLARWRIKQVRNESGGELIVSYSPESDCDRDHLPKPETNTTRCMPAYYSWPGTGDPTIDWFHKYVVTRLDENDLVTDQRSKTRFFDYLDEPAWHYLDDEITKDKYKTWGDWRGYGKVRVREGLDGGEQTAVDYHYLRGMDGDKTKDGKRSVSVTDWGGTVVDHEALNGFLRQEISYDGATSTSVGRELSATVSDPWRKGPTATRTRNEVTTNAYIVQVGKERTRTALTGGGFRYRTQTTTYNDDNQVTSEGDSGDEAVTGDDTCVRNTYARNEDAWILDKVVLTEKLSVACAGAPATAVPATVISRTRNFYDSYVDDSSFGKLPTRGNVVREEMLDSWSGTTPKYVRSESSTYDTVGRIKSVTDARGYTTSTDYGTENGGLVTSSSVTNPQQQKVTTVKEPAWDLPSTITDANEQVTTLRYDALGRLTTVWLSGRPTSAAADMIFGYDLRNSGGPTSVTTQSLLTNGTSYKKSINLYDGFLRQRQQQSQATGGGRLLTDTFYDTRGNVDWTSEAYYDTTNAPVGTDLGRPQGQIPAITQTLYDGVGRETAKIFKALGAEKWRTTTVYGGDRQTIIPPKGGVATTALIDAYDRTTTLRQYKNPADAGSDTAALFDKTTYAYDADSNLKTLTDALGNVWSYTYDLRGRQITAKDPDKGSTTTTYDAAGNVETVKDANNSVIAYTYDKLGRKTSIREGSVTGTKRAEWVYDTLTNGIGKQTKSIRYAGGVAYESRVDGYDVTGHPTGTSLVLPSGAGGLCASESAAPCTYSTAVTYKPNGATATSTVPKAAGLAKEKLTLGYNDIGEQTTLISPSQIYVQSVTYDKLGMLTGRVLGNTGSRVATTFGFDEPTRRLKTLNVVPELKAEAADFGYEHDEAGNIIKISDTPEGQASDVQCFAYDYLARLATARTSNVDSCAAAPSTGNLGTSAPYWQSWEFDAIGNRKKETRYAAAGNTVADYTYPASGATSIRPHAVTQVSEAAPGQSVTRGFTYDNAGNMKTRLSAAGAQQTLTWDKEGNIESIVESSKTTSFLYDADGKRLIRTTATGRTLYLPDGTEVTLATGSSAATATRYYSHKDAVIAVRSTAGLNWIINDHQGTAALTVNASTLAVSKRRTLPYGDTRVNPTTWPAVMDKGFVGGTKDPTGLTHLGARLYDPIIGRFLSVDPVIDPKDPQQLNAYAYGNNSPITNSDPNGEFFGALKKAASVVASAATTAGNFIAKTAVSTVESIKEDPVKFAVGLAAGIVATAAVAAVCATGVGCVILAGVVAGAAAAGAEYGTDVAQGDREFSVTDLGKEMAIGGVIGGATAGLGVGAKKLANGARRTLSGGAKQADDIAEDAAAAGRRTEDADVGGGCPVPWMSFTAATPVLLADGTTKPIGQIQLGDRVLATDPVSGVTAGEPVIALYQSRDLLLADITVVDDQGRTAVINTTQDHPFWNATTRTWTVALALSPGDRLTSGRVVSVEALTGARTMWNAGVNRLRTYYVMAGGMPVLVHNMPPIEDRVSRNVGTYDRLAPSGPGKERHHIPPKSTRPKGKSMGSGPSIRMDKADHRALYSTGYSRESQAWQQWQRELIQQGRHAEAMEMEYRDIERRFPGKYTVEIDAHRAQYATGTSCP